MQLNKKKITICLALRLQMLSCRSGARTVDLGGPKFEIKRESRCLQKSTLVIWGTSMSIGGGGGQVPSGSLLRPPCYHEFTA